ncbi:hypothetical protein HQO82_13700 [Rhodococcus fascians]|nr:hypothetical protein [Rhodococcus fascians]MBY4114877.1 hypothetical protein [Rhodococcus fascians]
MTTGQPLPTLAFSNMAAKFTWTGSVILVFTSLPEETLAAPNYVFQLLLAFALWTTWPVARAMLFPGKFSRSQDLSHQYAVVCIIGFVTLMAAIFSFHTAREAILSISVTTLAVLGFVVAYQTFMFESRAKSFSAAIISVSTLACGILSLTSAEHYSYWPLLGSVAALTLFRVEQTRQVLRFVNFFLHALILILLVDSELYILALLVFAVALCEVVVFAWRTQRPASARRR